MAEVKVLDKDGQETGSIELSDEIFNVEVKENNLNYIFYDCLITNISEPKEELTFSFKEKSLIPF